MLSTNSKSLIGLYTAAAVCIFSPSSMAEKVTQTGDKPATLRVCADPSNLPYSNREGHGFENKIASILARDLNAKLEYFWVVQHRGFVRNSLAQDDCDVLLSVPTKFGPVSTTSPYFTSSYVAVMRAQDERSFHSFDDSWLTDARIGLQMVGSEGSTTPPAVALSRRGLNQHITAFSMWSETSQDIPQSKIIEAVAHGDIDVAFVWGPFAGYFGKHYANDLKLEPIIGDSKTPEFSFVFPMSIGVRKTDLVFRDRLQEALDRHAEEITEILKEYNLPLVSKDELPSSFEGSNVVQKLSITISY